MPELPEVETVVRGLQAVLPGSLIIEVRLGKTDFIHDPAGLARALPGNRIVSVRRHGKYLVLDLAPDVKNSPQIPAESPRKLSLLVHLGMTGRLVTTRADADVPPHTHVFFALDDGRELRYTDVRRFGSMRVLQDAEGQKILGDLGTDALEISEEAFAAKLHAKKARIKAVLLDQTALRGMGNIYTDESLWRARIHPARISSSLKKDEIHRLYRAMRDILNEAIRLKGSSTSDYVDAEGKRGKFQQRHRVYRRLGEKCFRCGKPIQRAIVAGRSSYFCPRCQPSPRTTPGRKKKATLSATNRSRSHR